MTSLRAHRARFAVAALFATIGAHCASEGAAEQSPNTCASDTDCSGTAVCDSTLHVCVSAMGDASLLFVGTPPNGMPTRTAITTSNSIAVRAMQTDASVVLAAPVTVIGAIPVEGSVSFHASNSSSTTNPLLAQSMTPPGGPDAGAIADASAPSDAAAIPDDGGPPTDTETEPLYTAQVAPGVYDIVVTPTDLTAYPPMFATIPVLAAAPGSTQRFDFTLGGALATLSATLYDGTTHIPIPGVEVQVVDPTNGERTISTIATTGTGANAGQFTLSLSPFTGAAMTPFNPMVPPVWHLRLTSGQLVYDVDGSVFSAGYGGVSIDVPSIVASAGAVSGTCDTDVCQTVSLNVSGTSPSGATVPVVGATVDVRSFNVVSPLPMNAHARYEATGQTVALNGMAVFQAQLLPGDYVATITPVDITQFGVSQVPFTVGTHASIGNTLEVQPLVTVTGTISALAGAAMNPGGPMMGATVQALAIPPDATDPFAAPPIYARGNQFQTLADGTFSLPLDDGEYLLVVTPPSDSGYATQVFSGITVSSSMSAGALTAPQTLPLGTLNLSVPFSVSGPVMDSTGAPLAGATVRPFVRYSASTSVLDVQIGTATAGDDGRYDVLVPSTPLQMLSP